MGGGSKGSSQPTHTTQTVKQNVLPEYLQPYVTDVAGQAQAISREPYMPFPGQRIAGFDPAQLAAQQQVAGLQKPADFAAARNLYGTTGHYGTTAAGVGLDRAAQHLAAPTRQFTGEEVGRYMSPYQQAVTDVALRNAEEGALQRANRAALRSAGSGSAGGTRQAVFQAMADRDEGRLLGDIQTKGSERAFLAGQQQFERDRAAQVRDAAMAQQLFGAGMGGLGTAARGLAALGPTEQQAELQRISAQERVGGIRQAQDQRAMDMAYRDFLRQRDYPKEQMGWYSGILRGLPQQMGSSEMTYSRDPTFAQQAVGLGLAGLSAFGGRR
tara:strand:+ start:198 stop:1178 length:981 start_codon:yes stop_codon:yes gene_type:complete